MPLLRMENVNINYRLKNRLVRAVRDFTLDINEGDILGVIGESGSGKSTLAHGLMRILPGNGYMEASTITFNGRDILNMSDNEFRQLRWVEMSIVFQKAMSALSPVHKIFDQMYDAILAHEPETRKEDAIKKLEGLLSVVNLPRKTLNMYPHELSGGMMQRVMISLGLIFNPKLVILDEVTTALDVITQGQLLDEIKRLVKEFGLTVMMITHDIGVVNELCTKIAIVYAGELLEYGDVKDVIFRPLNPYTKALVESHPDLNPHGGGLRGIPGTLPDLSNPPEGCIFYDRCTYRLDRCREEKPELRDLNDRKVKCFRAGEFNG